MSAESTPSASFGHCGRCRDPLGSPGRPGRCTLLGETESHSGVEELIRSGNDDHSLSTAVVAKLVEESFEKAAELAKLLA